jgi:hypothetical protein
MDLARPPDPELSTIKGLERDAEINSSLPVKHGIYGLAKQTFAD